MEGTIEIVMGVAKALGQEGAEGGGELGGEPVTPSPKLKPVAWQTAARPAELAAGMRRAGRAWVGGSALLRQDGGEAG